MWMHIKKDKKFFIGISLLLLLTAILLGSGLAYALRPLHYRQDTYACALDGEDVLELKLDVTWNRRLWKPNEAPSILLFPRITLWKNWAMTD